MREDFWRLFEKTGSVDDYLHYACTSEESQSRGREEGETDDRPADSDRDGFISRTNWGI